MQNNLGSGPATRRIAALKLKRLLCESTKQLRMLNSIFYLGKTVKQLSCSVTFEIWQTVSSGRWFKPRQVSTMKLPEQGDLIEYIISVLVIAAILLACVYGHMVVSRGIAP